LNNDEFYRMMIEQMDSRMTRMEKEFKSSINQIDKKLDRLFSEKNAICQRHDDRLDQNATKIAVLEDRQSQMAKSADKAEKRRLSILGIGVTIINVILSYFLPKR